MAMTLAGFQGTVSEAQWGKLMGAVSQKYVLASGGDVTSTGRTVTVPPRVSIGCGVMVDENANTNLTVPTPTAGQWHLLVLRRAWSTRTASYMLLPHTTTTDVAQDKPPTSFPAGRFTTPGLSDDEPVAWIHTRASTAYLTIWQLSARPGGLIPGPWALWNKAEQGLYVWSTDWVYPTITGGTNDATSPAGYRVRAGMVCFRGRVTPTANNQQFFELMPGCRPPASFYTWADRDISVRMSIAGGGGVSYVGPGGGGVIFLMSINPFPAEQ